MSTNRHPQYSELSISRHLGREKFSGCLMAVDNTYFTGFEADLLVVTKNLRVIDVEIKISRADLKADRHKDKWRDARMGSAPREWPRGVWKHYYCVADPIWTDALLEFVNPNSGVFTIRIGDDGRYQGIQVRKKCKANKANVPMTPEAVVQLGHLANVRMHEAYRRLEDQRRAHEEDMRNEREKHEIKAGVARPTFYTESQDRYWMPATKDDPDLTPP